jgi:ADP-ribosyl-[dinitrogen reductase] hydrolase
MDDKIVDKAKGCLLGIAIGDAMGMPVETLTPEEIQQKIGGPVNGFMDPVSKRDWNKDLKAGQTTDDWQLTRAVARSLIRTGGHFDPSDCTVEHIAELDRSTFGWGKTTQKAIEDIKHGRRRFFDKLPPSEPGKGCGNGIIMKVAPLALCAVMKRQTTTELWRFVRKLGAITHPDIRASIAAFAVAFILKETIMVDTTGGYSMMNHAIRKACLTLLISYLEKIEKEEKIECELVSRTLCPLLIGNFETVSELRSTVGCGFHALETAPFTIGTFFGNHSDFRNSILDVVNAGGDADTNASIVGGLIGANCGLSCIPREWREFNPAFEEAVEIAEKLCTACE